MRNILYATIILWSAILVASCATTKTINVKHAPEYVGVAAGAQSYVDEYMRLSALKHITFTNKVSVGIKIIKGKWLEGDVIGLCTFGKDWREVDLDDNFLKTNSKKRGTLLAFHELTHCYCERMHDFKGIPYGKYEIRGIINKMEDSLERVIPWCIDKEIPGYLTDGCPASIMHPYIIDEECAQAHYDYYIDEMFEGCNPY